MILSFSKSFLQFHSLIVLKTAAAKKAKMIKIVFTRNNVIDEDLRQFEQGAVVGGIFAKIVFILNLHFKSWQLEAFLNLTIEPSLNLLVK